MILYQSQRSQSWTYNTGRMNVVIERFILETAYISFQLNNDALLKSIQYEWNILGKVIKNTYLPIQTCVF